MSSDSSDESSDTQRLNTSSDLIEKPHNKQELAEENPIKAPHKNNKIQRVQGASSS